jgi:hypothetical protein
VFCDPRHATGVFSQLFFAMFFRDKSRAKVCRSATECVAEVCFQVVLAMCLHLVSARPARTAVASADTAISLRSLLSSIRFAMLALLLHCISFLLFSRPLLSLSPLRLLSLLLHAQLSPLSFALSSSLLRALLPSFKATSSYIIDEVSLGCMRK